MPTLRSQFRIEQFEEVLQKLAHEIPRFTQVRTEDMTLNFCYTEDGRPRKISVQFHKTTDEKEWEGTEWERYKVDYWSFSIEPKKYMDSPHITKITFIYEGEKEKIEKYIQKLMAQVKPVPRFSLANLKNHHS